MRASLITSAAACDPCLELTNTIEVAGPTSDSLCASENGSKFGFTKPVRVSLKDPGPGPSVSIVRIGVRLNY